MRWLDGFLDKASVPVCTFPDEEPSLQFLQSRSIHLCGLPFDLWLECHLYSSFFFTASRSLGEEGATRAGASDICRGTTRAEDPRVNDEGTDRFEASQCYQIIMLR